MVLHAAQTFGLFFVYESNISERDGSGSIQRVSEFGTREAVDPVHEQILQTGNVNVNRFNRLIEKIRIRSAINLRIGGHGSSQRANHR